MRPTISVVINTRNEERNLPYALRSVASWVQEIVVVDMHSTDGTLRIAKSFGAKTFTVERAGFADPARAFAVAQATGEWILVLDADELIPEPLSRRLIEIASDGMGDVVMVARRNFLLGTPLIGSGWGPRQDVHSRFYRRGCLTFPGDIHRSPVASPGVRVVDISVEEPSSELAIQHFNYLGFDDFIERLNRYTGIEAKEAGERGESSSLLRGLAKACREFGWRFVRSKGYRDGWRGIYLSVLMGVYRLASSAKQKQLEVVGSDEAIEVLYAEEAERLLSAYPAGMHPGA